ncbi:hypothetical protein [Enterococcus dispar]|uniref:hypothetical protein n=1 Tax=Enterococcus dispar TaxID=44009 RepID=UPI002890716F|nr:hypothetical protein [Enterococcus dispar]MDT2705564.1 hypothetical protein [Enterococcus dispar]
MIYTNIVKTLEPMHEVKNIDRDFDFFKTCKVQRLPYPKDKDEELKIKTQQMLIVIAGTILGDLKRNNTNLVSRSLLFIDFDDVQETESEFLGKITDKLKEVNYCLYPTLKYKPDNIRYRLVLELDRAVSCEEYEKLLFGICTDLGIKFEFDETNKTWSQGQGLPVVTEHSSNDLRVFHDGFEPIPVDKFLHRITTSQQWADAQKKKQRPNTGVYQVNGSGKRKYTGVFLEQLFEGASVGNRNVWWRQMVDKMLSVDTPIETIAKVMGVINFNTEIFPEPLDQKELDTIFRSRVENHAKKGGYLY